MEKQGNFYHASLVFITPANGRLAAQYYKVLLVCFTQPSSVSASMRLD